MFSNTVKCGDTAWLPYLLMSVAGNYGRQRRMACAGLYRWLLSIKLLKSRLTDCARLFKLQRKDNGQIVPKGDIGTQQNLITSLSGANRPYC